MTFNFRFFTDSNFKFQLTLANIELSLIRQVYANFTFKHTIN